MRRSRTCSLLVAATVAFVGTSAFAQESLNLKDTSLLIVPSDSKVAIQYEEGIEPLEQTQFLWSHPYIIDTIPPDTLGRGFIVYTIDSTYGFAAAKASLSSDPVVKRTFPVYCVLPPGAPERPVAPV